MFILQGVSWDLVEISIICQGVSGRRPSFLAIHAKLAKINTSTFWGFEPGTNFCKKIKPGTYFCGRNRYGHSPPD